MSSSEICFCAEREIAVPTISNEIAERIRFMMIGVNEVILCENNEKRLLCDTLNFQWQQVLTNGRTT